MPGRATQWSGAAVFIAALATAVSMPVVADVRDGHPLEPSYLDVLEAADHHDHDHLIEQLELDPTFELVDGAVLVEEPVPMGPPAPVDASGFESPFSPPAGFESLGGDITEAEALALNSKPGSDRVIYLDMDGHSITDTAWNGSNARIDVGPYSREQPGLEVDGFSQRELNGIFEIWSRVAQDFAPWDVNITTEDPGDAALYRTGGNDEQYGTRIVITHDSSWYGNAGGVAYVGGFGNAYYSPAFVFSNRLQEYDTTSRQIVGGRPKSVAEAASHEAGHTLGLSHDGVAGGSAYYSGHGDWAPIMGSGYGRPVTQWSRGEYPGANNTQDDLAIIDRSLPGRNDSIVGADAENSPLGANDVTVTGTVGVGGGTSRHSLTAIGPTSIIVEPADPNGNLLARLSLIDDESGATRIAEASTATGWTLTIADIAAGDYTIEVHSVGWQTPSDGFSSYASIGSYLLSVDAPDGVTPPTSEPPPNPSTDPPTNPSTDPPTDPPDTPPTEPVDPGPSTDPSDPTPPAPTRQLLDTITPVRLLDTRDGASRFGRLSAGETIRIPVAGSDAVPDTAIAAVVNVTAVQPVTSGYLSLTPCSRAAGAMPTSSLNYAAGTNTANSTIATLAADGTLCIFASSDTDVVVDVTGSIGSHGSVGLDGLEVRRAVDTRTALGLTSRLSPNATAVIDLADDVGSTATAVAVNVTAIKPQSDGFLQIDGCDRPTDSTSALNFTGGQNRGNNGIFELGAGQTLCITSSASTDVAVDITSEFSPDGLQFVPASPRRLLDTRATSTVAEGGVVAFSMPLPTGSDRRASAASVNVASLGHPGPGYVTAWNCDTMPEASALNPVPDTVTANGTLVAVGEAEASCLFHSAGGELIVDLNGWWV